MDLHTPTTDLYAPSKHYKATMLEDYATVYDHCYYFRIQYEYRHWSLERLSDGEDQWGRPEGSANTGWSWVSKVIALRGVREG